MTEADRPSNAPSPEPELSDELRLPPLATFLDRVYGTLFTPQTAFAKLRSQPSLQQAIAVVFLVNLLEALRVQQPLLAIPVLLVSFAGWFVLGLLLQRLAAIFQRQVELKTLLTLTAFAGLPWLFLAPAQSLESPLNAIVSLLVLGWFAVWQIWAAAVALELSPWLLMWLVPLALAGGLVGVILIGNVVKLILSIV